MCVVYGYICVCVCVKERKTETHKNGRETLKKILIPTNMFCREIEDKCTYDKSVTA